MPQVTTTLKLKFLDLNQVKADLFAQTTAECTALANRLLKMPLTERRKLTTAKVVTALSSALANQVIRNATSKSAKKVKQYRLMLPEVNKQNWKVAKVGDTYSLSFPTIKGVKRVPLEIAHPHHAAVLDRLLVRDEALEKGSLKLAKRRGQWYALCSITQDVPEVKSVHRVGCDRGQNNVAVVATPEGKSIFFKGGEVKHRRRRFQTLRTELQKAGKKRAIKKLNNKESRWMREVNHAISKAIARFADYHNADVVMEDLSGCRGTMRQSKQQRADAGNNRHRWAYYDLQLKTAYKMELLGRQLILRPAPYTSQSDSRNGILGKRSGHTFTGFDGWQANSDWNAARNIAKWDGFACPLGLYVPGDGVFDSPQDSGSPSASGRAEMQMGNSVNTQR
ncbi:RNA-guided endonuclease TnpB family protein [Spirulina major]|uniref:RNA-guided endonuclease TnpB family protein n=1 Tax=Spirulina major TaxID=270636 RepID=UPI000934E136|nr:RNA-guided endonuclease TnpB family protein [Spirulina major]